MNIINFIKNLIISAITALVIIFALIWILGGTEWCNYKSDYYITGTVVSKMSVGRYNTILVTIMTEDGEIFSDKEKARSDCPNSDVIQNMVVGATYKFRIGIFDHQYFVGIPTYKEVEEHIISASFVDMNCG